MRIRFMSFAAFVTVLLAPAASAQGARISGTVTDTSGRALANVTVQVVTARNELITATQTALDGTYSAPVALGDTVRILARRLGYAQHESGVRAIESATIRYDIRLAPLVQQLGGVVVHGQTNRQAFRERAAAGMPHAQFVDSAALAGKDKRSVASLIDELKGLSIQSGFPQAGRTPGRADRVTINPTIPPSLVGPGNCPVHVYVDGWPLRGAIDQAVRASDIAALEVYADPALAPVLYRYYPKRPCPLVLIWTTNGMDWVPQR